MLPLRSGGRPAEARANLSDTGVASVLFEVAIAPGTTLEELLPLSAELARRAHPRHRHARPARGRRARPRARAGAREAPLLDGLETYTVFLVRAFDRRVTAADLLEQAPLASLLLGERDHTPLSRAEREDVLKHHYSYLETDLAVVDWNSAFVHEPSGLTDVPDLLELATAHLLELRYYDALLDRELRRIYDEISGRWGRASSAGATGGCSGDRRRCCSSSRRWWSGSRTR